jgi:hypothetical protein
MKQQRWESGEILVHKREPHLKREIVDICRMGYGWKYPDLGDRTPAGGENYCGASTRSSTRRSRNQPPPKSSIDLGTVKATPRPPGRIAFPHEKIGI